MEDSDEKNDFVLGDAISKLYKRARQDADPSWKKKLIIGSLIGLTLIIILIVILIVLRSKKSDGESPNNGNNENNEKEIIADIDCVYKIDDISKKHLY
jgi:hypothetical protein